MKRDDYVIVKHEERNHLIRLTSKHVGSDMHGMLEKGRHLEPKTLEFSNKQVIAHLGPKPSPGTAYGCKIEPWQGTKVHKFWGDVHIFRDLTKVERTALKMALDTQAEFFHAKKLAYFAPLSMEIRPANGTYSGHYAYTGKEDVPDTMTLCPKSFAEEPNPKQELIKPRHWTNYVINHEGAHGVWFRGCNSKVKARWIAAYHATLQLSASDPKDVIRLGREFAKSGAALDDFASQQPEELTTLFEACLAWIKDTHNLNQKHLKILTESGNHDAIGKMWPDQHIIESDFEIPIGEYASKSPEEFFAEAFSMHYTGKVKIPKNIRKLLEKTVSKVARR